MTGAIAIDLGTTRIKAAVLNEEGLLTHLHSVSSPPLKKDGLFCESDPLAYYNAATMLLNRLCARVPQDFPIGVASQRSSFLMWDKKTGNPETPLISWQDRRAHDWCTTNQRRIARIIRKTGLLLSPHYAGSKLAFLLKTNRDLRRKAWANNLLFGTLETWLIWKWTHGQIHETDLSMAARTLLLDINKKTWGEDLLEIFGIPEGILPAIKPTLGRQISGDFSGIITSTIADQAGSVIPIVKESLNRMLVNLGTGGFVIYPIGKSPKFRSDYLTAPLLMDATNHETLYALEGTINGIGNALEATTGETIELTEKDSAPNCFCSPETSGLGSPFWLPKIPFTLSERARSLNPSNQRRVIMEGIIFRIYQIIQEQCEHKPFPEIYLSGGLSAEPFIYQGLAACLEHPIHKLQEKEMTLLGTALLATNSSPPLTLSYNTLMSFSASRYLQSKYQEWRQWITTIAGAKFHP